MSTIPPHFNELIKACTDGNLPQVLELLPSTNPKWFKSAALRTAAANNHTDIVLTLLPHSHANAHDNRALKSAISNRNDVLFDALFPLCTDVFTEKFYSIYATIYALWPEKLGIFEHLQIPQGQYDMALQGLCFENKDPTPLMHLLKKTSVKAQKAAMIILLENTQYTLFDLVTNHNDPRNCVEAMVECLEYDYTRAKNLFQRCSDAKVPLTDKVARHVLVNALEYLDWHTITQAAPLANCSRFTIMEQVVEHNDLDVYTYFEQLRAPVTSKSAEISAKLGNKELTARQINKNTVSINLLHWISAQGWNDLLSVALKCMSKDLLNSLQHGGNYGFEDTRFVQCVRNQHYNCLAQILSHVFVKNKRTFKMGNWVFEVAHQCSSDPLLFETLSQNLSAAEIDQIVTEAYRRLRDDPTNGARYMAVIENLVSFVSRKIRIELFDACVQMCSQNVKNEDTEQLVKLIAPYIKNKDITSATQWWWDIHQSKKFNAKLSKKIGGRGAAGAKRKI